MLAEMTEGEHGAVVRSGEEKGNRRKEGESLGGILVNIIKRLFRASLVNSDGLQQVGGWYALYRARSAFFQAIHDRCFEKRARGTQNSRF